jgi:hypothetical protein
MFLIWVTGKTRRANRAGTELTPHSHPMLSGFCLAGGPTCDLPGSVRAVVVGAGPGWQGALGESPEPSTRRATYLAES